MRISFTTQYESVEETILYLFMCEQGGPPPVVGIHSLRGYSVYIVDGKANVKLEFIENEDTWYTTAEVIGSLENRGYNNIIVSD